MAFMIMMISTTSLMKVTDISIRPKTSICAKSIIYSGVASCLEGGRATRLPTGTGPGPLAKGCLEIYPPSNYQTYFREDTRHYSQCYTLIKIFQS